MDRTANKVAALAIAYAVTSVCAVVPDVAIAASGKEKCGGVVKKGNNDCGANNHACQGQSKEDGHPDEWLMLPNGICDKLVNGNVIERQKQS